MTVSARLHSFTTQIGTGASVHIGFPCPYQLQAESFSGKSQCFWTLCSICSLPVVSFLFGILVLWYIFLVVCLLSKLLSEEIFECVSCLSSSAFMVVY